MKILWRLSVYIGSYTLSFISCTFVIFRLILNFLKHGKTYYYSRTKRTKTPVSLFDKSLGSRGFVILRKQGIRLHYVTSGNQKGPMMLMIHGFPDFWYGWRHQLSVFDDYCIVAVDMRGYGCSDKPTKLKDYEISTLMDDILELISMFERDSATIVGHNLGGIIAWFFSAKYPKSVEKLIVLNAPHPLCFKENILCNFINKSFLFFFQNVYLLPEYYLHAGNLEAITGIFKDNGRSKCMYEEIEAYKFTFSDPKAFTGPLNYFRTNLSQLLEVKEEEINKITVPTLIIWGEDDFFQHVVCPFECTKYCTTWRLRIIRNAGHWAHHEEPTIVNDCIRDFLNADMSSLVQ